MPANKKPAATHDAVLAAPKGVTPQQRAASLAQAYDADGKIKTQAKDWTPKPSSDGTYGSPAVKQLCEEFGKLAADIVGDFTGGK